MATPVDDTRIRANRSSGLTGEGPVPFNPGLDIHSESPNIRRREFPHLMLATGILWIVAGVAYLALLGSFWLLRMPLKS
jgi:hypothetical protein